MCSGSAYEAGVTKCAAPKRDDFYSLTMRRAPLLALLLLLAACDLFGPPAPPPSSPTLRVEASATQGKAPLLVSFTATLEPATTQSFNWWLGAQLQDERSSAFSTTFETPGVYVVSVEAAGALQSMDVTVSDEPVTEPGPEPGPGPQPDPGVLRLSQTPGGVAPWAVRYTPTPNLKGLEARCHEAGTFRLVETSSFTCVHEPGDKAQARSGEMTATVTPDVTENQGVAFAGRWRYSARGETETFTITRGDKMLGSSPDGRFKLFTVGQNGERFVEFTISGQTVVLTPTPDDQGRQLYEGSVYGLTLEPLPSKTP